MDVATLAAPAFSALNAQGLRLRLHNGADGDAPAIEAVVASVAENPRGTMPGTPRIAFSAMLHLPPTIVDYGLDVWISAEGWPGRIGPLHISRVGAPSPADAERTVYQLVCN